MIFKRREEAQEKSQLQEDQGHSKPNLPVETTKASKSGNPPSVLQNSGATGTRTPDPLADDLTRRVMVAIGEWITANNLESIPRHVAFEQALSILNAIDRSFPAPGKRSKNV